MKIVMEKGKRKKPGLRLTGRKAIAGYFFILPFILGFMAFMFFPLLESLRMVFSTVKIDTVKHGFSMTFSGLANLNQVFFVDPEFTRLLTEELRRMVLSVPAIIIFSIFAALLLNQQFRGRGLVRAIFFLPVILASGVMVGLETSNSLLGGMAEMIQENNAVRVSISGVLVDILASQGAMSRFMLYVFDIVNQVQTIVMASGIQIVIFLSALQTIPPSVFEAAKIEGATEWECFWKITFPMISSLILVNVVYSVVDFFLRTDNSIMNKIRRELVRNMEYGFTTAIAWVYFLAVMIILGITATIISKKVYYYE